MSTIVIKPHLQEIQTNEHGQILITGEDGQTYPVQVSGHQLVTVPTGMYQTVVANIQGSESGPGGQVQVEKSVDPSSVINPISGDRNTDSNCGTVGAITARCGDETGARRDRIQSRAHHHPCLLGQS